MELPHEHHLQLITNMYKYIVGGHIRANEQSHRARWNNSRRIICEEAKDKGKGKGMAVKSQHQQEWWGWRFLQLYSTPFILTFIMFLLFLCLHAIYMHWEYCILYVGDGEHDTPRSILMCNRCIIRIEKISLPI